jgi:hypothetical protein
MLSPMGVPFLPRRFAANPWATFRPGRPWEAVDKPNRASGRSQGGKRQADWLGTPSRAGPRGGSGRQTGSAPLLPPVPRGKRWENRVSVTWICERGGLTTSAVVKARRVPGGASKVRGFATVEVKKPGSYPFRAQETRIVHLPRRKQAPESPPGVPDAAPRGGGRPHHPLWAIGICAALGTPGSAPRGQAAPPALGPRRWRERIRCHETQ